MIYEGTIQYVAIDDNGNDKSRKESFVLENQNFFAEVENVLHTEFEAYTDLDVIAIKRSKVREIVNTRRDDDDRLWMAEMQDTFTDDEGEEKDVKYKVLLYAHSFDDAKSIVTQYAMQGYNMVLVSLKLTKFEEVLK